MEDLKELDDEIIQLAKNKEHEDFMKLILYRSQRKWYATISIICIFAVIIILMMVFMALGKDLTAGWKEVLLVMVGAFVGSWGKVIDFWFNNSEQDNTLLETASDDD
jgi:hypothetical protein|tara:strand:+ start:46 stop:366 length:321 start_codon:yes stop_codon:yes gene_type:complete